MEKRNILVTGFEKYGNYKINPTEEFLKNHSVLGNYYMHSLIFPPNILSAGAENFGREVVDLAIKLKAVAIISLGMSSEVKGLRIESMARNWCDNKYCLQSESDRKLDMSCQPWQVKEINLRYWDIGLMFKRFRSLGIKFEEKISIFPGYYCCNALMYRTLKVLRSNEFYSYHIPYLFLQIPCTAEAVEGVKDFDKTKDLITLEILRQILLVVSESYVSEPLALSH